MSTAAPATAVPAGEGRPRARGKRRTQAALALALAVAFGAAPAVAAPPVAGPAAVARPAEAPTAVVHIPAAGAPIHTAAPAVPTAGAASAAFPVLRVVSAHSTGFAVAWPAIRGAHHYETQASARADFAGAPVVAKYASRYIGDLRQNTAYNLRYRAVYRSAGTERRSAWSAALRARTPALFPGRFTALTATPGANAVTLRWGKVANASAYTVRIADNKAMTQRLRTFRVGAGTTSRSISGLNSRDGQPRYVRIQATNGPHVRTSARLEVRPAAPRTGTGEPIRFASQNMLCATCRLDAGTPAFSRRWPLVLAHVRAHRPDVLLLQEAANTKGTTKHGMFAPFAAALSANGYGLDRRLEPNGANGAANRIAFKTAKYTKVRAGSFPLPGERRITSWVLLKSRKTGKQFYAVSAHVSPTLPVTGKVSRTSSAEVINARMNALNTGKLPVLMGGDMNVSQNAAATSSPHAVFIRHGWTDMASAPRRAMADYPTSNGLRKAVEPTWGRIDYLYTRHVGGPVAYRNVVSVSKGRITSRHGSDHNLIVADTRLT